MKTIVFILFSSFRILAQHFQMNDPYPSSTVTIEINFQVEKYYPIFGISEKPFTNERIIRLTDLNGTYTAYIYFNNNYIPQKVDMKEKILRLYYPQEYYDYIIGKLEKDTAFIVYREYKDDHKWGEIYFDKYP